MEAEWHHCVYITSCEICLDYVYAVDWDFAMDRKLEERVKVISCLKLGRSTRDFEHASSQWRKPSSPRSKEARQSHRVQPRECSLYFPHRNIVRPSTEGSAATFWSIQGRIFGKSERIFGARRTEFLTMTTMHSVTAFSSFTISSPKIT